MAEIQSYKDLTEKVLAYKDLTEKVLDKQNTLLSPREIQQLNKVKGETYAKMKKQIANHKVSRYGKSFRLEDFVKKIDVNGQFEGKKIVWGSELGAWVQVFLISQNYDIHKQNNSNQLGIDGKIGKFTSKSLSAYKGDQGTLNQSKKYTNEKIDNEKANRVNAWLQGAREFSKNRNNPLKVNILDRKNPFVIGIENYGQKTIIDLNKGTMSSNGIIFKRFTNFHMEKVGNEINIETTSKNTKFLSSLYRQASLINKIFGEIVKKKGNSDSPFYGDAKTIYFDNGIINDTDIVKDINVVFGVYKTHLNAALGKMKDWDGDITRQDSEHICGILNKIYQKRVREGEIK